MDLEIRKRDRVFLADGQKLGRAMNMIHPTAGFGTYPHHHFLLIVNHQTGRDYYIPTKYIDQEASEEGEIMLTVNKWDFLRRDLMIKPPFVRTNNFEQTSLGDEPSLT
ncbi:MAG: hypothetical protein KDD89_12460 [Anaerolineales bacterium]|nr:hypothetical protein [Anaerolineales bacterium]